MGRRIDRLRGSVGRLRAPIGRLRGLVDGLRERFGRRVAIAAVVALLALAAVVLVAVDSTEATRNFADVLAAVLVVWAIVVGLLTLGGSTDEGDDRLVPPPWTEAGGIVDRAPERTSDDPDLSGDALAGEIQHAGRVARQEGTVADGLAALRPTLRPVLRDALVRGGIDPTEAERRIDEGAWTDDPAAAATLSAELQRPDWPLRERVRAWLFPERVVQREARRAVHEIARTAAEQVPTVPGRSAPRTVPVVRPGLAELRRGADGELQRAVDPIAAPRAWNGEDGRMDGDSSSASADVDPGAGEGT